MQHLKIFFDCVCVYIFTVDSWIPIMILSVTLLLWIAHTLIFVIFQNPSLACTSF